MKKITYVAFGFEWCPRYWRLWLWRDWWDGPYWNLDIGPFYCLWSLTGLPYIFWKESK